jgi:hypothetical protein
MGAAEQLFVLLSGPVAVHPKPAGAPLNVLGQIYGGKPVPSIKV